jgi:hypothetical protein
MRATYPAHLLVFDFIILTFGEKYELSSSFKLHLGDQIKMGGEMEGHVARMG